MNQVCRVDGGRAGLRQVACRASANAVAVGSSEGSEMVQARDWGPRGRRQDGGLYVQMLRSALGPWRNNTCHVLPYMLAGSLLRCQLAGPRARGSAACQTDGPSLSGLLDRHTDSRWGSGAEMLAD
jgi:hypothetical protein